MIGHYTTRARRIDCFPPAGLKGFQIPRSSSQSPIDRRLFEAPLQAKTTSKRLNGSLRNKSVVSRDSNFFPPAVPHMDDVSKHTLVPEHQLLSEEETAEVLDEYEIRRTDLPKIKESDPALPADAEPGDVIKIVRDSRTTEQAIGYRLVIE